MNSSKRFCIQLLGSPLVAGPDGRPVAGRAVQRHRIALLALLELATGRSMSRDKLMGLLWPESDTEAARRLLNQAVYHLRRTLGENGILSAADELHVNPEVVQSDVASFESALASGDHAGAVSAYRGPFMDGFFLNDAPEFDRWMEMQRQRLGDAFAKALEALAHDAEQRGDVPAAVEWWKRRASHDPFDSSVAVRLVEVLARQGNRAGALQHAALHSRLLHDEFGIAPSPQLTELAERLRAQPEARPDIPAVSVTSARALHDAPVQSDAPARLSRQIPIERRRWYYGLGALVLTLVAAAAFWLTRPDDSRWLTRTALPRIEKDLDVADWESAYRVAREVEKRIPRSRELAELWPRITWRVTIQSQPESALVYRQAYNARDDAWEQLGKTPLVNIRIPYGASRLRLELPGYQPLHRVLGGAHLNWTELKADFPDDLLVGPEIFQLDTDGTLPAGMVRVSAWTFDADSNSYRLPDFFIGRYEVTNAEYKRFVDAGGYQQPSLWDTVVMHGDTIPWRKAMQRFVDRTGRPGPSTWEAGDYPHGQANYPVSGVSWYEASAYARFIRQQLATAHHWQQALANALFPWMLPLSNFSGQGPRRVNASRAMSHVGTFDMTGNVREWTSSSIGNQRVILGGSWTEPYYTAGLRDASAPPEDRSPANGFRTAITHDPPQLAAVLQVPLVRKTAAPVIRQQPVSDDVYAAYSRVFDYDRSPLNATVEAVDTTRLWIRQRVKFAAAYGDESALLHLYLPTRGRPPYQVVIYWPGWDTFSLDDADEYFAKQIDFIVKSGRAVAFPIYRGIFDRRQPNQRWRPEFGTAAYRDNTIYTVKDLRRTIDYLDTRPDIKRSAIGYFGYSWGGVNGPVAMAQEPRIRVGIIDIGLLPPMAATPEVDPVNSLPRVRVPTLMFSGEFDSMVPKENSARYFSLIGTASPQKRHVIAIGGHFIPRELLIRETLDWLDKYLGQVE